MRKRILFNTYPIAFNTPGGGEIQLMRYYEYLNKIDGTKVDFFNQWNPSLKKYNLVHFFSVMGGSNQFCGLVKELKIPLFITSSLWITDKTLLNYPMEEIKIQLNMADKIIVNSNMEANNLSTYFQLNSNKFVTIYNGVSDFYCEDISEDIFINKFNIKDKFLLNVGNIEPRKNQLLLVKAMRKYPNYKLVLIGHVRDEEYFKQIREISSNQIIYLGNLEPESDLLKSAYVACAAFVLPSILETPGLAALEAAAAGAKIVITEIGSTSEYFGNKVVYVNPYDVESIIAGIEIALISRQDLKDEVRKNFAWKKQINALNDEYSKFLSEI